VELARQGDVGAFTVLVERHRHVALRVAYAITPTDAEDAVQEAFVKAYQALPRFRSGAPFRPWVLRIVTNEARNQGRRGARQARLAVREAGRAAGWTATPEEAAVGEDVRRRLAEAVSALPDRDREVIALRWFAGLTEAEMAVALDCRPGTVKSRLSRALDRLRTTLPEEVHQ
jgi:RNA polymerase sigma factor (sigma-70 family)